MRRAAIAVALTVAVWGAAEPADAIDDGSTVAVSRPSGFGPFLAAPAADSSSDPGSTSADGNKVVFSSRANGMSADDDDLLFNIYVRDRAAHTTTLVSRSTSGQAANDNSFDPVISADGNWVAWESAADNLVADDNDHVIDAFVRHLPTGTTLLVSRSSAPDNVPQGGGNPALSANGTKVAFTTAAAFDAADNNQTSDVYLRDLSNSTTQLISRSDGTSGAVGSAFSFDPAMSGNGERIAFTSNAAFDTSADTNGQPDVYMRDISTHTTSLISRANTATGAVGDLPSQDPSINQTGSRIAFSSQATNLTDDTDTRADIFVRDLSASTTLLASRGQGPSGVNADSNALSPSIDSSGAKVAFVSAADNLGDNTPPGVFAARVRDLSANTTTAISRAPGQFGQIVDAQGVALSASGSFATFTALAPNFSPDDANDFRQVYTRDLAGPTFNTDLVSRPDGTGVLRESDGDSELTGSGHAVSADGRYVVFVSTADGLSPDDNDNLTGVYRRDVVTGDTILISRATGPDGAAADGDSQRPSISADGDVVAFESDATNLVPGDTNGNRDVFVRRVSTGTTDLVSRQDGAGGAEGDKQAVNAALSGDGRYVVFNTQAQLTGDDNDGNSDVFRRDLVTGQTLLVSRASGADGANANAPSDRPVVDAHGEHVAFQTSATNLDAADTTSGSDVYERDIGAAQTALVSRADGFGPAAGDVGIDLSISDDGGRIAFEALSALVADDSNSVTDAYVRDVASNRTLLAARSSSGVPGNSFSIDPSLSADGNRVAFVTSSTNLASDLHEGEFAAIRDLAAGTMIVADPPDPAGGRRIPGGSVSVGLDGPGHCVAFTSNATDALPGGSGTGEFFHVFLHATGGPCPEPAAAVLPPGSPPSPPPPAGPGDTTAPSLAATKITPTRFAVDKKSTPISARAKKGAKFSWQLSEPAQVTLVIERSQPGRRRGRKCVKPTRKLRRAKKCTRWVADGTLKRRAVAGAGGTAFTGRIGSKALGPGKHRARIYAADAAGNKSGERIVSFTILRR